jgi:hypothetical protein
MPNWDDLASILSFLSNLFQLAKFLLEWFLSGKRPPKRKKRPPTKGKRSPGKKTSKKRKKRRK